MIPIRFALTICLFVPLLTAYSQSTDQTTPAQAGSLEFRSISAGKLATFEKELGELASQGFRLDRVLESFTVFYQAAILSRWQPAEGAAKYEYKLLTTRRASTLEKELEVAANEGYEVRGLMSVGKPYIGSEMVLVLERLAGSNAPRFQYRILSAGSGKENKVDNSLQKAVSEGFRPVKVIRHMDVGLSVFVSMGGPAFLIILSRNVGEKAVSAIEQEYKALETVRISTMEKEINQAAKDGYCFAPSSSTGLVLMTRETNNFKPRCEYKLHELKKQTEEKDLLMYSQQGFDYRSTFSGMGGMAAVLERDLRVDANSAKREYKLVKFPNKEDEKEEFQKEMSEAVTAGFRFLDLTSARRLAVVLVR